MNHHKPDIYQANLCPPCPADATHLDRIVYWLGIGLGSGLPTRAAGTWGTLGGLAAAVLLLSLGFWVLVGATLLGLIVGSYICGHTSRLMGIDDDPHIVWDEWVGMWLTLLPSFFVYHARDKWQHIGIDDGAFWAILGIGFGLFRAFDVLKPFPISLIDKHLSGGFGIMLDDVLAGIIAGMLLIIGWYSWVGI